MQSPEKKWTEQPHGVQGNSVVFRNIFFWLVKHIPELRETYMIINRQFGGGGGGGGTYYMLLYVVRAESVQGVNIPPGWNILLCNWGK